ncbi:hypothetical protein KIN20_024192 [Parelaphostrongylus tenuis]|uniref:Uncharacterized protein n=1 Tax=Parelaphostrongylus tenuis TaxID=148309 RepID=A0AAD5QWK6_PARTN|nr:hypothetical protein KIN20_024192 [Parelaphostrongylus tenuis]
MKCISFLSLIAAGSALMCKMCDQYVSCGANEISEQCPPYTSCYTIRSGGVVTNKGCTVSCAALPFAVAGAHCTTCNYRDNCNVDQPVGFGADPYGSDNTGSGGIGQGTRPDYRSGDAGIGQGTRPDYNGVPFSQASVYSGDAGIGQGTRPDYNGGGAGIGQGSRPDYDNGGAAIGQGSRPDDDRGKFSIQRRQ